MDLPGNEWTVDKVVTIHYSAKTKQNKIKHYQEQVTLF